MFRSSTARVGEWLKVASDTPAKQAVVSLAELKSGELRDTGGKGCLALVTQVAGLESAKEVDKLVRLLRVLRRRFIEHGLEGWAVRSSAVNEMDLFLRKMVLVLEEGGRGGYALILKKATTGSASMAMVSLSGAVAFQAAAHACHSVILASGTLAPFKLLQRELGVGQGSQHELFARSPVTVEVGQSEGIGSRLRVLALSSVDGQRPVDVLIWARSHTIYETEPRQIGIRVPNHHAAHIDSIVVDPSLRPVHGSALRCQSCEVGIQLPPRVFQTVDEGGDGRSVWKTGNLGPSHQGEVAPQRCLCLVAPASRIRWPRLNEELLRPGSARRAGRGPGSFPVAPWLDLQKARGILGDIELLARGSQCCEHRHLVPSAAVSVGCLQLCLRRDVLGFREPRDLP
eukprot:s1733_g7.t1